MADPIFKPFRKLYFYDMTFLYLSKTLLQEHNVTGKTTCFSCVTLQKSILRKAFFNINYELQQRAVLSHILPCSSSLRGVSTAERMKWPTHCLPQLLYT